MSYSVTFRRPPDCATIRYFCLSFAAKATIVELRYPWQAHVRCFAHNVYLKVLLSNTVRRSTDAAFYVPVWPIMLV